MGPSGLSPTVTFLWPGPYICSTSQALWCWLRPQPEPLTFVGPASSHVCILGGLLGARMTEGEPPSQARAPSLSALDGRWPFPVADGPARLGGGRHHLDMFCIFLLCRTPHAVG